MDRVSWILLKDVHVPSFFVAHVQRLCMRSQRSCACVQGEAYYHGWMDRWMPCDFTSFSTVFQSYQDDVRMIMKGCVQWNFVYG